MHIFGFFGASVLRVRLCQAEAPARSSSSTAGTVRSIAECTPDRDE